MFACNSINVSLRVYFTVSRHAYHTISYPKISCIGVLWIWFCINLKNRNLFEVYTTRTSTCTCIPIWMIDAFKQESYHSFIHPSMKQAVKSSYTYYIFNISILPYSLGSLRPNTTIDCIPQQHDNRHGSNTNSSRSPTGYPNNQINQKQPTNETHSL